MRVLVVDDLRMFTPEAAQKYDEIVYAKTSQEAFPLLSLNWDIIFLDHDLGLASEEDGTFISKCLCEMAFNGRWPSMPEAPFIVIHSSNPSGAKYMFDMLHKSGFPSITEHAINIGLIASEE